MKRIVILVFFILFFLGTGFKITAKADSIEEELLSKNKDYLSDAVPDDAKKYFDDKDITFEDTNKIFDFSVIDAAKYLIDNISRFIKAPLKLLGSLMAIILLIGLIENMNTLDNNEELGKVFDIIGILICIAVIYSNIAAAIESTKQAMYDGSNFMLCYIPIFSGVVGTSGCITSASVYSISTIAICQFTMQIASRVLVPLLSVFMAFSIVEAINPALSFSGFTKGIKKFIQWSLGLIMTIFVALITIQSIVGVSADTVGVRTAKFMASSFIPVIGSAISDAYTTVKSSIGLLRSGVGTFGIVVLILTMLPVILNVACMKMSISIASYISEIMSVKRLNNFLNNISSVFSLCLSFLLCFAVMMIVSTTILMMVCLNLA